jgi:hypothetical protein
MSEETLKTEGFDYSVLEDFCKVRNTGMAGNGGPDPSPRLQFVMNLLDDLGIEYELDRWVREYPVKNSLEDFLGFDRDNIDEALSNRVGYKYMPKSYIEKERNLLNSAFDWFELSTDRLKQMLELSKHNKEGYEKIFMLKSLIRYKKEMEHHEEPEAFFNLYLHGTSDKMIMAHHDVVNIHADNTNDNSASVINAIACKTLMPDLKVAITDGEEIGGIGAKRTAQKIVEGYFGDIEFVLNFELTAVGGKNFFIEDKRSSNLFKRVEKLFPGVETHFTPFHDGIVLREFGIDSIVINPLPRRPGGRLDFSLLSYCHSFRDNMALAKFDDMKDFCEKVVTPIITGVEPDFKISDMKPNHEEKSYKGFKSFFNRTYDDFNDDVYENVYNSDDDDDIDAPELHLPH